MNENYIYLGISLPTVHVSKLRKYTGDYRRFVKYLPISLELAELEQSNKDEWSDRLSLLSEDDIDNLVQTEIELLELTKDFMKKTN